MNGSKFIAILSAPFHPHIFFFSSWTDHFFPRLIFFSQKFNILQFFLFIKQNSEDEEYGTTALN